MIRLALLLALAFALEAGAQTFPVPGPGHVPWTATLGGGGGGIAGVSKACADSGLYGSGGACVCSEPLDVLDTAIAAGASNDHDMADSPNTHECWGPTRFTDETVYLNVQDGVTLTTVDVSSRAGWGDVQYALLGTGAPNVWAQAPLEAITSSTRLYCISFYQDVDDSYASAGSNGGQCPGTNWRNKIGQFNYDTNSYQAQENGDSTCPAPPNFRSITISINGGPADGNYTPSPSTNWNACDEAPCRFDFCVAGQILTGAGINLRLRVKSLETGTVSTSTTPTFTAPAGIGNQSVTGGDWWHSGSLGAGGDTSRRGYFTVWAWDTDSGQWPPFDCEIEGGC